MPQSPSGFTQIFDSKLFDQYRCREVTVNGLRVILHFEQEVWKALDIVAKEDGITVDEICSALDSRNGVGPEINSVVREYLSYRYNRSLAGQDSGNPNAR